jgi:DNA-binding transcriptional ArsR family regulator
MTEGAPDWQFADRLGRLEQRVARLEASGAGSPAPEEAAAGQTATGQKDVFWALDGLKQRIGEPGAVLYAGAVSVPGGEHYEWQIGRTTGSLLDDDWTLGAAVLGALAHPVRLRLLQQVLHGVRTAAELGADERLGTSGQLYHHLRQLVSAGWLRSTLRGQYAVPPERVVPLLVILAAARS